MQSATAKLESALAFISPDCGYDDWINIGMLARKFLEARHKQDEGDQSEMIAFGNSALGLPWEYRGELPEEEELRARAEQYAEWTVARFRRSRYWPRWRIRQ